MQLMSECVSFRAEFPQAGDPNINGNVMPPDQRMLAALWYFATEDSYRSIANKYEHLKYSQCFSSTAFCLPCCLI